MSIRMKLILSYIAMILIPIVLFVMVTMLLTAIFLKDVTGNNSATRIGTVQMIRDTFTRKNEIYAGLNFLARNDTKLFLSDDFLAKTDKELKPLKAGFAVLKGGQWIHVSPWLNSADLTRQVRQLQIGRGGNNYFNQFKINGIKYAVKKQDVIFVDHSSGTVYFFEDNSQTAAFFRRFFPLLFLSLLLVIGGTNGILTYLLSRSIIRPLQALKQAANQIKEGDLDHELKLGRKDELGQLGSAFEEMRCRLKESIRVQLQYEENRKELISSISHDLKTPITAITSCVEGLKDGIASTPEKQMKYFNMIHKKAHDMDHLIDELFMLSKLDLKRLPFHFEEMDVYLFLRDRVEELQLDPQKQGVWFVFEGWSQPLYVIADREKLERVIANIVDNSVKHMDKAKKEIRFELIDGIEEVTVKISDNGSGIDRDALPHIFESFYREDLSRNTDKGGSGLGLAIVKQIVEEHGGKTWAESKVGEGTRLFFTLKKSEDKQR
jgi:signal transduction histidine kinase